MQKIDYIILENIMYCAFGVILGILLYFSAIFGVVFLVTGFVVYIIIMNHKQKPIQYSTTMFMKASKEKRIY